jgi:hypothetical protein
MSLFASGVVPQPISAVRPLREGRRQFARSLAATLEVKRANSQVSMSLRYGFSMTSSVLMPVRRSVAT